MAAKPEERWTRREMLELASRGLGKIDALGARGVTLVTMEEIAAMAGALAAFGLVPTWPGHDAPAHLIVTPNTGERA